MHSPQPRKPVSSPAAPALLSRLLMWGALFLMYGWCMLLPLAGKAGRATPYAGKNFLTVLGVLVAALLCAFLAGWGSRRTPGLPGLYRWGWKLCCGIQLMLLVLLLFGAFGV